MLLHGTLRVHADLCNVNDDCLLIWLFHTATALTFHGAVRLVFVVRAALYKTVYELGAVNIVSYWLVCWTVYIYAYFWIVCLLLFSIKNCKYLWRLCTLTQNVPALACYNFDTYDPILIILGRSVTEMVSNQSMLYFSPYPTNESALPRETGNPENAYFI